jgi:HNH endonuclease
VSRAGHRAPARTLGRWALPGVLAFFAWLAENTPGGVFGFLGLVGTGLLVSLFYPLAVLMAIEAPGALVPWQWRAWWRKGEARRPGIAKRLRRVVYAADGYACAFCRSSGDLQLDHMRPWSLGGRTSFFNSMTLCGQCNRVKSNYWRFRNGRVTYHSFDGYHYPVRAAEILAFELRRRHSIRRFVRAAIAL